jgi:hypothetical protein
MPAIDLTKMNAVLGEKCQDPDVKTDILTGMMYNPAIENRITVIEDAIDEIPLPNATIDDPLSPLKDPAIVNYKGDVVKFGAEVLKVKDCIVAVKVIPWKLRATYLGLLNRENLKRKQNRQDPFYLTFEDFILNKLKEKAAEKLYMKALFKGVRDEDGDSADDLFDGFNQKIADKITAMDLTPVSTGAFTSTNTYDKILMMYDAFGEEYKGGQINFHAPPQIFDWMQRLMNPLTNISTFLPRSQQELMGEGLMNAMPLPGINAIMFREPAMQGSGRVIATVPENLFLGFHNNIDDVVFRVQEEDLSLKFLFVFKAGTEIGLSTDDFGALIVNNQS